VRSHPSGSERRLDVLVLAPYPPDTAPNQRFRFEQYIGRLEHDDIHLEVSSYLDAGMVPVVHQRGRYAQKAAAAVHGIGRRLRDLAVARAYDLVLISRESAPLGPPLIERLLGALEVPYAFDFDDAIYLPNSSPANRAMAPFKFAAKASMTARHASLVIAGNEQLASWARQHTEQVVVIPSTIDTAYHLPRPVRRDPGRPVCVGWTGSVTTLPYLEALAPVLRDLQRDHGVRLRVIGDEHYRIEGAVVEALPWRRETEIADLQELDIGLMPLPDDEWARGKCGLKALQYMAIGIPAVMSPVGVNPSIAEGGVGRLASTPAQWRGVLEELIGDPGLRAELGARGRDRVQRHYSVDAVAASWAQALRSAAARSTL
jgi:glycosyltransferase involved in cell wall biosynthesis